jgi:isochorismate synthase
LGDFLTYRIPRQEIIQLTGDFIKVQEFDKINGFIVSSFNKNEKYQFVEKAASSDFSFSEVNPICYSESEYNQLASDFLTELKVQNLSKAIFSRIKSVEFEINPFDFFEQLCANYPDAFVYLISSPLFGTWIGASPEILLKSKGKVAETISLAGTLKRDSSETWQTKEREEQNHVTAFIESKLRASKVVNLQISDLQEVNAGPVRHLKTSFQFGLGTNSTIEIAEKLHPTPAVSGFPQKEALQLIEQIEQHDRKIYAGIIGVIGKDSAHLYVNLRCAEIIHHNAYLYLGGGFTKDSLVNLEWEETENKAKTLLNVMKKQ